MNGGENTNLTYMGPNRNLIEVLSLNHNSKLCWVLPLGSYGKTASGKGRGSRYRVGTRISAYWDGSQTVGDYCTWVQACARILKIVARAAKSGCDSAERGLSAKEGEYPKLNY